MPCTGRCRANLCNLLFGIFHGADDDIDTLVNAEDAGIQADVIILGLTPSAAGVVLIVHAAALILLVQTRLRALVGLAVQTDDAVGAEGHIRENEGMQRVGTILQNVVRVPADDDASAFLRQLKNHAALDIPQEIGCGQAVHHAGNALGGESVGKQTAAGGMLAVLFHKFGGEAGLQGDLIDSGAIDAGKEYTLTAAEREYIFFTPSAKKLVLLRTGDSAKQSWISGWRGRKRPNGNYYPNSRLVRLTRALGISDDEADAILEDYWTNVFKAETEEFVLDANDFDICIGGTEGAKFYRCKKCGRVTPYNVKKHCASVKCAGMLEPCDPLKDSAMNHYARLYSSSHSEPLYIKEHTAQLAKDQQTRYQEAFVQKKINALSCSTTFEMGVDVGSLETVYMRDVPPSPSNYVQRAGRAGRAKHSAAFVMTYAKLSSHDFTYYDDPTAMISGKIKAPIFEIENEKILNRHIFAVALSSFFAQHKEVYAGEPNCLVE